MDPKYYGLIEMALTGAVALGFGFWQLWSVSQAKKRRLERERREKPEG